MKHKITGDIFRWNSSIWDFNRLMRSVKPDEEIDLTINSMGGDAFTGIDIMNTLRSHKGTVTVTISGIAASAASVMCMGADKVKAYSNTQMMLHFASSGIFGNAKALRKRADDLESIDESVLASYTHRVDEGEAKKMLEKETYLSAKKALEIGLIDEIVDAKPEKVESEVFENKAKEFNNKLSNEPVASSTSIDEETLKEMFAEFKNEIRNELQQNNEPPEPKPTPAETKQNLSKLFLNYKNEGE
ncbi:head maturation protease, ClpP-related [Virgibacillus oceani]|uniref:ATP-dependent Clp protease proteolytic subunit n=1 Tax=Virgibacillus oceani TaxID=1479511 RepID=A0A917H191_9BACI|nr:head maturation protease, ClpP-related [Virgibacillus oceani]GGG64716.1 hypothetical protein GCM10011398_05410 [Virgibacillus oceani]